MRPRDFLEFLVIGAGVTLLALGSYQIAIVIGEWIE